MSKQTEIVRFAPAGRPIDLFDQRPIELAGFRLRARFAEAVDEPTIKDWATALQFAYAVEESSWYWLGDLWNYAQQRPEWEVRLPQVLAEIGLDVEIQTLYHHGSVSKRVSDPRVRAVTPSFAHAREVASLTPREQYTFLKTAKEKGLSTRELRMEIRAAHRPMVLEGQAALEGKFRVVYADPPWKYNDNGAIQPGDNYARAERHYPTLTIEELCMMPVRDHVMKNAVLFLWTTVPFSFEKPGPREVMEAWGFDYKTHIAWDKVRHNYGHYVSVRHELLLIATRGACLPDRPVPMVDSVQTVCRSDEHSEKPREFRKIIEQLYDGPRVELFARSRHEGWISFGNDAKLWDVADRNAHERLRHAEQLPQ